MGECRIESFTATPHRALWHEPTGTWILADLHLGYERALRRQQQVMPSFSFEPLKARWTALLERRPKTIIIAGDLFHARQPDPETLAQTRELFDLARGVEELTILAGNHDPALSRLEPLLRGLQVPLKLTVARTALLGSWRIMHGDQWLVEPGEQGVICGHQHPAVVIQKARMICYAQVGGEWPRILLPAFSTAPLGSNLLWHWDLAGPRPDNSRIQIYGIVRDQVLDFGRLSELSQAKAGTPASQPASPGDHAPPFF